MNRLFEKNRTYNQLVGYVFELICLSKNPDQPHIF